MKMIIRADDVGYTKVHNIGTFETLDNGVTTSVDIMLDTPGTVDALERMRHYPWISMGWHTHFWGAPVLDVSKVPSLYDASIGHFRRDLARAEDATAVVVLHPGYVDYYVCREGSQTLAAWNYLATRAIEAHVLCTQELKDLLQEHKIELVNFRDALYGTSEYQNHLRATGSALCVLSTRCNDLPKRQPYTQI